MRIPFVLSAAALLCACGAPPQKIASSALIGGVPADSARLDSIGALVFLDDDGKAERAFCNEVRDFLRTALPPRIRDRVGHGLAPHGPDLVVWQRILHEDNNYALLRYERVLQARQGYTAPTLYQGRPTLRYLGGPEKLALRYRASHSQDFSVGFSLEKDAGEPWAWQPGQGRGDAGAPLARTGAAWPDDCRDQCHKATGGS